MDFSRIKHLVKQGGDKFILVENGEAELVVMSFKEYEKLLGGMGGDLRHAAGTGEFVRDTGAHADNSSFDNLEETEFVLPAKPNAHKFLVRLEDIRLEDLPV